MASAWGVSWGVAWASSWGANPSPTVAAGSGGGRRITWDEVLGKKTAREKLVYVPLSAMETSAYFPQAPITSVIATPDATTLSPALMLAFLTFLDDED